MPFLMSFALEPEIVTVAWIDNASVQFPLNIYATKGSTQLGIIRWFCFMRSAQASIYSRIHFLCLLPTEEFGIQRFMDPRESLVALNMIEHVGPVRVRQLLEHFGDAPAILRASKSQLLQVRGIGEETAEAIANWEKSADLSSELRRIQEFGCHILTQTDDDYPDLLRQIYDPPVVLYVKGRLTARDKNAVAMVGSRLTTHYGLETGRKLA